MGLEDIKLAYEKAIRDRDRAFSKLMETRNELTRDDFERLLIQRGNLAMIEHRTLSKFIIDDDNREVVDLLYAYITHTDKEKINPTIGIVVTGAFGCGKSILMSAFCKVLNDLGIIAEEIQEIHAMALSEMIKADGILPWAKKPLLIQDMCMEENVINAFGTKINPIGNLLAVRAEYGSLTFGSANKKWASFEKHYSEYIGTRSKEHVNFIYLKGESRRKDFRKPETM